MIIHHYYPHRNNVGDYFVRDGIQKLFRKALPDARFIDLPVNKPHTPQAHFGLIGSNLDYSNNEADLIIIGGSNLYQCRKNGAWGVVTNMEAVRRIKRPIVLIGLGAGSSLLDKIRPCSEQSREEICHLNKVAIGSSVRDVQAGEFLHSLGLQNYVVTGCPATFLFDKPFTFGKSGNAVAISFPPARFKQRYFLYWRLMRTIKRYAAYCRRLGLKPILVCHEVRDMELAKKLGMEIFCSDKTRDYYDFYEKARLVVGFRLHAAIISLSLGTPFIPIYFDGRGIAFAQTYDSLDWTIDGTAFSLLQKLIKRTNEILDKRGDSFVKFLLKKQTYKDVMNNFVGTCAGKLK